MKDDNKTKKQLVHELTELRSQNAALEKLESAEKLRSLVENIRDVIYELDSQGVVLYISPAIRDLLGYDSAEIVGKNFIELAHKDDQSSLAEWFSELRKGREDPSEYRILNKSGELRWARTKTRPIMEDGLFKGAHGILIDVTDQRRMEEALRMLAVRNEAILAAVPDIIMEVDVCKRYTWANQAGMRFFGEDVIGREASYYFEGGQETYNKVQPLFNGGEDVIYIESWQRRQDGEKRLLSWWCKVLKNEQGLVIGALSTGRDITDRKQAEEELRESEEKYRNILENIEDGYFEVDLAGNLTFCNDSVCRMVGQTHAEMMGMNNRQYTDKENSQILYQAFNKIFRTGEPSKGVEYEIIGKEGTKLYIESSVSLIKNTSGQPIGFRGIMRNITERKRAEEANRNAEAHYHALFEQSPKGILLIDPETGKTIEANETAYKQLGYTREEFGALRISDYETLEKPEETAKHIQKVIHDGIDDFETLHRTKSGEIRNVHVWAKKVQLSNCSFIYTLFQDITDRKQAEEALRESQRQQKAILDNIPDIAWLKDRENRFIAVNGPFGKSCGFKPEDLVGKTDFDIWPRDLAERYRADDKEVMESGKRKQVEEPLTDSEGKTSWIETIKTPIYDERGNFVGTAGIARYITERKRAQEALRESEEKFRTIFDKASDGILIADAITKKFLQGNATICSMLGYTKEEIESLTINDIHPPKDISHVLDEFEKQAKGEKDLAEDLPVLRKDGSIFYADIGSSPAIIGGVHCLLCIFRDITERKRAESEIRALARFPSENPNPVLRIARDGTLLYVNAAGLSQLPDWHLQAGRGVPSMVRDVASQALTSGKTRLLDLEHRGQVYSFFVAPIADAGYTNMYGRDITNRKRAEAELLQTLDSLRKAVGTTIQVMVSAVEARDPYTAGHQIRSANLARAIATEMGLPPEKIEGIRMAGSIHDIGKLSIPAEILSKPTKLSELEFSMIKEHSQKGYEMLKNVESPWPLAEIVFQHHERMDGSGYPRNLKGEEILIEARILTVADVVEAMASHRPYRPGLGIEAALNEIEKNGGTIYDKTVADACLRLFREKGFKLAGT